MSRVQPIKLNIGIDQITQQDASEPINFRLDKSWAAPAGIPESHIKKLFSPDTTHQLMDDLCRPQLTSLQMLLPILHKQQRKHLMNTFENTLNQSETEQQVIIQNALDLLEQETQNLSLLDRFRYALLLA